MENSNYCPHTQYDTESSFTTEIGYIIDKMWLGDIECLGESKF